MDELENLINRAEDHEIKTEAAQKFEPQNDKKEVAVIAGISPEEAAGNMAESVLFVGFSVCKFLMDSRLEIGAEEIASGRESLAPVIQKYNLAMGGTGRLPWYEEIMAGLYIGGLYKRIKRALSELKANDKAKREANEQANQQASNKPTMEQSNQYGQARKYQSQEQSHAVLSEVGIRKEPNLNPNF